ncbi:Gfo/Idh/MocA family protein [Jiella sp. M17.18]|uniref:Gfo/Idh/MocA family protein n=1 Tax=Jiella sp. M17.18 TaxID=3234247 RepID=UPI0034DF2B9B
MAAIGIGLIGTGYMGKCHALAWNAVSAVFGGIERPRLAVLAEAGEDLAAARAAQFGFVRATGDWRTLVDDPAVDVVSITVPNHLHAEMATAFLAAGKHVWCEKPMATSLADAERMLAAARASGRLAALGYNYIQNPMVRQMGRMIGEGAIGRINDVRVEMDEDFMADPGAPFCFKDEARSGHGAADDFGVHPLSLLSVLVGLPTRLVAQFAAPHRTRRAEGGQARAVETFDIARMLMEFGDGATGSILLHRGAWGRKGRIAVQIFGSEGTLLYDQERMNELQYFDAREPADRQGFRTILAAPAHEPYGDFVPAPGHGLGFNDLKVIEARELLRAIAGEPARLIDFEQGIRIERVVDAMARSHREGRWIGVGTSAPSAP